MRQRVIWLAGIIGIALPVQAFEHPETTMLRLVPEQNRLREHLETLASPEFEGRRGKGGERAAEYIVEEFRSLGLKPLFENDSYDQPIPGNLDGKVIGRNVGAMIEGSDLELREEWVILSAHYDHLGIRNGVLYPGADDNASGVAMLLEVARCVAESAERPRRSVMFVSFDLEEDALRGSRHFVRQPPVELEKIRLFLTADMIGRALGGVCEEHVFVAGTEHAPELRPAIKRAAEGRDVVVGLIGADLLAIDRSDYGPFRARRIPFLFFSTGENPVYHTSRDVAETINYPKLEAISVLIHDFFKEVIASDSLPDWTQTSEPSIDEAIAIRDVLRILLKNRESLEIGALQLTLMRNTLRNLDAAIDRGTITPGERIGLLRVAQLVLFTVL